MLPGEGRDWGPAEPSDLLSSSQVKWNKLLFPVARFPMRHCSLLPSSSSSPPQRAWTFQKQGLGHLPGKKRERAQYTWKDQESQPLHPSQVSQKPARGVSLYPLPFLTSYDYNQQREKEREIERAGEEGGRKEGKKERGKEGRKGGPLTGALPL